MAVAPGRFSQVRWLQNAVCVVAILSALLLICLGLIGVGSTSARVWMLFAGGFLMFLAIMFLTFSPLLIKMESTLARQFGVMRDVHEVLNRHEALLTLISENTHISDAAKSLAHREQELGALRTAIREDVRNERWDAALTLVDEIERRFGYKDEADRIREELDDARQSAIEKRLQEAIEMVESHFQSREWPRAQAELERIRHALPDHARVLALQERMHVLKEEHKQELLQEWALAVRRNDTDQAIDVLRALDQYLSQAEAQSLQDSARHVFKEKLLQLGVQFRFAVTEKRWQDALSTGLELTREFPNSRMASEVREVLDTLRERARAATVAEADATAVRQASA